MKRLEIALLIGLAASILLSSFSSFGQEWDEVRPQVVRLHILANSDSEEDQQLKLDVRDYLLEQTADLFATASSGASAKALAERECARIETLAQEEIVRQGYSYPVRAQVTNRFFDTRVYDGFTLPAGRYDAVQVEIGSGQGQNWWCVMFPPLCVPAASEKSNLPLEDQIRALGEPPRYKPAFAVVEVIETLQEKLSQ